MCIKSSAKRADQPAKWLDLVLILLSFVDAVEAGEGKTDRKDPEVST